LTERGNLLGGGENNAAYATGRAAAMGDQEPVGGPREF
jgi:hypothetical protein